MIANKTNLTEIKPIYILQEPKLMLFPCSQFTKKKETVKMLLSHNICGSYLESTKIEFVHC